jgi:cytochrome b subunit of formate dehydrogenase
MVVHWLLDLGRHIKRVATIRPQIRRMRINEIWQHNLVTLSFIVLVISGFALRFSEGWLAYTFFGWEGGFELRGVVHRYAAVLFILVVVWHLFFIIVSGRGRRFVFDMLPQKEDFIQFWQRLLYNLGRRPDSPRFDRFSYVEKAEYWALVWGTIIMIATGILLWFDNWFVQFLPKGVLDVSLVIHYWEAWLATLAILVWHMYSVIFSPSVYPMNPSWLTGTMPQEMYQHEHPEHLEEAVTESKEHLAKELERFTSEAKRGSRNSDVN